LTISEGSQRKIRTYAVHAIIPTGIPGGFIVYTYNPGLDVIFNCNFSIPV